MFSFIKNLFKVPAAQVEEVFVLADKAASSTAKRVDSYVAPMRKTIFQKFPVLFGLLVTTGVAWVILGIEQIILKYNFFENHPEFILFVGVVILAFTGRLYKKLSD